jgi:hypothetical protein
MRSLPVATITRAASITPNASTGAMIAITASETISFVVKAFIDFSATPSLVHDASELLRE